MLLRGISFFAAQFGIVSAARGATAPVGDQAQLPVRVVPLQPF